MNPLRWLSLALIASALGCSSSPARAEEVPLDAAERATVAAIKTLPCSHSRSSDLDRWDLAKRDLTLARLGRPDLALASELPTRELDREYPRKLRDEIWRLSARRFALRGELDEARHAETQIESPFNKADALLAIARALLRAHRPSDARITLYQVLPQLRKIDARARGFAYTAYLFAESGDLPAARRVFKASLAAMPPADSDEMRGGPSVFNHNPLLAYWNYRFKAGLGRESLDQLPQQAWTRTVILETVLEDKDFPLAKQIIEHTKDLGDRSGLIGQLGGTAFQDGNFDVLRESIQLARETAVKLEQVPAGGFNEYRGSPDLRVPAWLRVAFLQELLGPADEAVLSKIDGFIPSQPVDARMWMFRKDKPTRADIMNGLWLGLSRPDLLPDFPPARRRDIAENAFEAIHSLPSEDRTERYLALAKTISPCPVGPPLGTIMAAATDAARQHARDLNRASGLYDLIHTARTYRELGDPITASALVDEILQMENPRRRRQEILCWMAADGIWEPLLGYIQSGHAAPFVSAATWQCTNAPSAPPAWILNLHDVHNRTGALIGWAEGLTKLKDEKLAKEEEEIKLTSYNYVD